MRKTLLALAILAIGGLTIGAATTSSAVPFGQAGSAGIVEANIQLAHGGHGGHGGHHGRFFRGGLFLVPYVGGSCYENCRYYHGPRYCHASCGY